MVVNRSVIPPCFSSVTLPGVIRTHTSPSRLVTLIGVPVAAARCMSSSGPQICHTPSRRVNQNRPQPTSAVALLPAVTPRALVDGRIPVAQLPQQRLTPQCRPAARVRIIARQVDDPFRRARPERRPVGGDRG